MGLRKALADLWWEVAHLWWEVIYALHYCEFLVWCMMSIIREQHDEVLQSANEIETMQEDVMETMQTSFMCAQALNHKLSSQIETMQGDMMQAMQDSMSCVSRETQAVNAKLSRQIETMQSDMRALVPFMQMIRHHIEHHVTVDHNVYQISAQNLTVGGPLPFIRPPHEPEPAEAPPRNFPMSVHTPDRLVPFSGSSFTLT